MRAMKSYSEKKINQPMRTQYNSNKSNDCD